MEFFSEEGEQGGPPGLRAIGGAFGGGVGGKESGEARRGLGPSGTLFIGPPSATILTQ